METIKFYIKIDCFSFTILTLANSVLAWAGMIEDVGISANIQLFIVTSTIACLMFLTDRLFARKGEIVKLLAHVIDILASVVLWGLVFDHFSFSQKGWVITVLICVVTYLCVSGAMAFENKRDADDINDSIKKMRLKK